LHENTNNHDILFKNANYIKILSKNGNNVISSTKSNELIVKIVPWGPNQAKVESITGRLLNRSSVKRYLKKSLQQQDLTKDRSLSAEGKIEKRRLRLLSFELIDDERIESNISTTTKKRKKTASTSPSTPPKFYRSIYYDYDNNCSLIIKGNIDKKGEPEEILESREQPLPNREEFEDAIKILEEREPDIGNVIRNNILRAYRPMPPLINEEKPDGSIERTLAIGLLPKIDANSSSSFSTLQYQHEIVGVNMISQTVRRFIPIILTFVVSVPIGGLAFARSLDQGDNDGNDQQGSSKRDISCDRNSNSTLVIFEYFTRLQVRLDQESSILFEVR